MAPPDRNHCMPACRKRPIHAVNRAEPRIALVSAPWPLFNRPSVQLASLKAFAAREIPHLEVDCRHLYLPVAGALGYDLYQEISQSTWLSECCYAGLLYPERRESARRLWLGQSRGASLSRKTDFKWICKTLETVSDRIVRDMDWAAYRLAGFSICFGQLSSTLYFIRRIRERAPALKVLVGGSACGGSMGVSLLRAFPEIDFVISGEGELPLVHLLRHLTASGPERPVAPMAGQRKRGLPTT